MNRMKITKATSLFAAASVVLAALATIVSPILDLDCGGDPGHFVTIAGAAPDASRGTPSDVLSSPCDNRTTQAQPEGHGNQEGEAVHVHGMNNHGLPAILVAAIDFGTPFFLSLSLEPRMSDVTVGPPC